MAMLAAGSHPYSIALCNQPTPQAPSHSVAEAFSSREFPGACGNDAPIDLSPSPPPSFPPSLPDLLRLPDMVACMSFGMAPLATAAPRPRTPLVGTSRDGQAMGMKLDRRNRGLCRITPPAEKRPIVRMSIAANSGRELPEDTERERWKASTVAAIVLGGGAGTRLFPLTMRRAKPAVPIGGAYRLIDVPISNCINSGIRKVFILTQFNSASLNRHIAQSYNFNSCTDFGDGFFEVLAATQTPGDKGKRWFQGTADAVRQFLWLFDDAKCKDIQDVIILSGDHLYRMDYMDFVQTHRDTGADITISCVPMDESPASDSSLMKMDGSRRIISFSEEPKGENLKAMAFDTSILGLSVQEAAKYPYLASMGVYVFKKNLLLDLLRRHYPTANDFGSEVIPGASKDFLVRAYLFNDYWEDIGTIKSFFEANLALTAHPSRFHFYDATNPMYTSRRNLPPSTVDNCKVIDSIISHGSFLSNCVIEHSVIGIRSRVTSNAHLKDTVMLGADFYETDDEIKAALAEGKLPVGIGENTHIRNCIIDKNARIGKNVTISNSDGVEEGDRPDEGFYIRSGITIVTKNATICDGFTIKFFVISTKDGIPENAVRKSPAGGDSEAGDASNFDSALTMVT